MIFTASHSIEAHAAAAFGCNMVGTLQTNFTIEVVLDPNEKSKHDMALEDTQCVKT
jgi:hypothetical protein